MRRSESTKETKSESASLRRDRASLVDDAVKSTRDAWDADGVDFFSDAELRAYRDDLARLHLLSSKSRPSAAETRAIEKIVTSIEPIYVKLFRSFCKRALSNMQSIDFVTLEDLSYYRGQLESVTVPACQTEMSERFLKRAIAELTVAGDTVWGIYATLSSLQLKLDQLHEHAQEIVRFLSLARNQWQADALFHVLLPETLFVQKAELEQVTRLAKLKHDHIESVFEKVSRYITVHTMYGGDEAREPDVRARGEIARNLRDGKRSERSEPAEALDSGVARKRSSGKSWMDAYKKV